MIDRGKAIMAGAAVLGVFVIYWLLSPRPVLVETAEVRKAPFTAYVEEDGRTRVRERYVISAPLSGRVPRTPLRPGDNVKAGQIIAMLTPNAPPLIEPRTRLALEERVGSSKAALEEAIALQERAQVQVTSRKIDLDRIRELRERAVVSAAQLDHATFAFRAAERDREAAEKRRHAAEHAVSEARAALKRSSEATNGEQFAVTSPIDGRILKVIQESEGFVGLGAPLFEVADTADLEVIVDLLTSDAAGIREGARALLERSGIDRVLEGRVRRVEPSGFTKVSALGVEEQRVWVVIDITSPREQWRGLADGFRVGLRIIDAQIENATVAPIGALFRRGATWNTFVVSDSRAELRTVEITHRSGREAAISKGLQPGDTVIMYPPSSLQPGAAVRIR